jgi:hypothetical protein
MDNEKLGVEEETDWHVLQPIEVKCTNPDVIQPCPDAEVANVGK